VLFTSLHLLHFDTQRNVHNFTAVYILLNTERLVLLTSATHRQHSFIQSRPKCKVYNSNNLKVIILQIITSRKHKTLQLHIQGHPIIPFHNCRVKS